MRLHLNKLTSFFTVPWAIRNSLSVLTVENFHLVKIANARGLTGGYSAGSDLSVYLERGSRERMERTLRGETLNYHINAMGTSQSSSLILETLTSTDKLLRLVCAIGEVYKIFESQPYLVGHVTCTDKCPKTQTAFS